jgi:hypothetical protein
MLPKETVLHVPIWHARDARIYIAELANSPDFDVIRRAEIVDKIFRSSAEFAGISSIATTTSADEPWLRQRRDAMRGRKGAIADHRLEVDNRGGSQHAEVFPRFGG